MPIAKSDFTVRFVYIGQADATLITTPSGETLLYDAGTISGAMEYLIPLMDSLNIRRVDIAIASHMHSDHIAGFPSVFANFPLYGTSFDHGETYESAYYNYYLSAVGQRRATISIGDTILLGDSVQIICYASGADGLTPIGENEKSVAIIVRYKGFDIFLGGDLTGVNDGNQIDIESHVAPSLYPVEVFRANHHGSRYCNNENILAVLKPQYSIISCGINNQYGFPHRETVERLSAWGEIYRTDISGTITVTVVDSTDYNITTQF